MLRIVTIGALVLAAFGVLASAALAANVTMTSSAATVATGGTVRLTTTAPPYTSAATLSQTLTQAFDPTKLQITGSSDVTAPEGWALTYSTDGSTFSSGTPSSWAEVRAVRATGTLTSDGSSGSRQIASSTQSVTNVAPPAFAAGGSGDGFDVAFDDRGYVFNIFHHNVTLLQLTQLVTAGTGKLDCHVIATGARCSGTWPYSLNALGFETLMNSVETVDNVNHHVWFPTNAATNIAAAGTNADGFACIDVSTIAAPAPCGGSAATGFVQFGTGADLGSDLWNQGSPRMSVNTGVQRLAVSGSRAYSWQRDTGKLICLDMTANGGLGAECSGGSPTFAGVTSAPFVTASWRAGQAAQPRNQLMEWDGRIYGAAGSNGRQAVCVVAATNAACPGWTNPRTLTAFAGTIYVEPTAAGGSRGMCFVTSAGAAECFSASGDAFSGNATLGAKLYTELTTILWNGTPTTGGSRVYFPGQVNQFCFNLATPGYCSTWGGSSGVLALSSTYTTTVDPNNPSCVWMNSDNSGIKTRDADGNSPCTATPSQASLNSDILLPKTGCTAADNAIASWGSFTLTAPSLSSGGATGATLTVLDSSGNTISGWSGVTINPSTGRVDLSTLSVADSGQKPLFQLTFTGRAPSATTTTATVVAIGDAPQLCITAHAQTLTCPAEYGPSSTKYPWTATITGSGSVTPNGGSAEAYGEKTTTVDFSGSDTTGCNVPKPEEPRQTDEPKTTKAAKPAPPRITFEDTPGIVATIAVPGAGRTVLVGKLRNGKRACTSVTAVTTKKGTVTLSCQVNAATRRLTCRHAVRITVWAIYRKSDGTSSRTAKAYVLPKCEESAVTG